MTSRHATGAWSTELLAREQLDEGTLEVILARPDGFRFRAGQFIRFDHRGQPRDYSLASAPAADTLRLWLRRTGGGGFPAWIADRAIGSSLRFRGPRGYFVDRSEERPRVWVATGTGLAPFASMLGDGVRPRWVFHGVRSAAAMLDAARFATEVPGYRACISRPGDSPLPRRARPGRVTDALRELPAADALDVYLCGSQAMLGDAMAIVDERLPGARVFTEAFY